MDKSTNVTLASRSQSAPKYGNSAGKQCTGMSVGFALYSETIDLLKLKTNDINTILDLGNDIYEACSLHYEKEILAGDELPTDITYNGIRYRVGRGQMRYGFIQDFRNLTFQVTNVFCTYTQTLLICKGYTVMLKFSNGQYFLFDSHKKDKFGRKHADGKASIMRFRTFSAMLKYVSLLFQSETREQYDLVPIQLKQELAKSGSSPDIRCYFRRKSRTVLNHYESEVMPNHPEQFVTETSANSLTESQFETYRKRKSPSCQSTQYESEMQQAKRKKSDVATCVLGPGQSVLYVDSECTDKSDGIVNSESDVTDSNDDRSRSKCKSLKMKKIGNGWCVVKCASNPILRQRDRKQIQVITSGLSFPHGTVVTLLKTNGVWNHQREGMSCSKNVFQQSQRITTSTCVVNESATDNCSKTSNSSHERVSRQFGKEISVNISQSTSYSNCSTTQSVNSGKENVDPSNHSNDVTSAALRQRLCRDRKKQKLLDAYDVNNDKENLTGNVDPQDLKPCKLPTASALKQRAYRARKKEQKLLNLQNETQISQSSECTFQAESPQYTNNTVHSQEFKPSQEPTASALKQRAYRARKKEQKLINLQNETQISQSSECTFQAESPQYTNNTVHSQEFKPSQEPTASALRQRDYRARKKEQKLINLQIETQIAESGECTLQFDTPQSTNNTSSSQRQLSMTPGAVRQRANRAKRKLEVLSSSFTESVESDVESTPPFNDIEVGINSTQSMTPGAIRTREYRARKRAERALQQSTSEDEERLGETDGRSKKTRTPNTRNYRMSRRKQPLYHAPIFVNNDWSLNNHYGNPCQSGTLDSENFANSEMYIETPSEPPCNTTSNRSENSVVAPTEAEIEMSEIEVSEQNPPLIDFQVEDDECPLEMESLDMVIPNSKLEKLNESVDHVCSFCTKLCFPEQGKYYSGVYLEKYKVYLRPDFTGSTAFICRTCNSQISKEKSPIFNKHNGISWPVKVPQLDIFDHEERLICLRLPFMHIQVLPSGGQKSLKGNVINVPADIHETIFMLPRHINDQGTVSVRLKRRLQYRGVYRDSNVRPAKVLDALKYLKDISTYYQASNLQISYSWLSETIQAIEQTNDMPINNSDNVSDNDETNPAESMNRSSENVPSTSNVDPAYDGDVNDSEDNFSEVDHTEIPAIHDTMLDIIPRDLTLNVAPGEGQTPLHLLYDKQGEEMSFPTIYCGKAIDEIYPRKFNFLQRTRWELTTQDRRAAQKTELIFFKYKMYQLQYIREQGKLALRFVKNDKQYTARDLRTDEQRNNITSVDDGFFFYRKLRNSPQYLQQKKRELFATIRQLGIPTFFVSLSAADTKWPELLQSLGKIVDNRVYTFEEIEHMSYTDKTRLVNSDPVTCARYFDRRFQYFLKHILGKPPYPLGRITDHFYRIEFQHRGSPHVHMILFSESSPKYQKDKDNASVLDYIDKYISCSLDVEEEAKPYVNYQVHKHSKTCRKGGRATCRFNYPLPPFDHTVILRPNPDKETEHKEKYVQLQQYLDSGAINEDTTLAHVLEHFQYSYEQYELIIRSTINHDKVFLKRKPCECRVNMYIRNMLTVWKANMDCQFCIDPYSVVSYIVNYINKENRGLSLNLAAVTRECEQQKKSIRETIKKLGNVFINTSEICVQECVYILLGMALAHQSVDVENINTSVEEKRVKLVKNPEELRDQSDDSTEIYRDTKFDIYMKRPPFFDDWTFADYVSIVRITPRTAKSKQSESEGLHVTRFNTRYVLDSEKRYSMGRKRVLSFYCPRKSKDQEEYFRIHLLIFHPWRLEYTLNENYRTYKEIYTTLSQSQKDDLHENSNSYTRQNLDSLQEIYSSLMNDGSNLVVAAGADHLNAEDLEMGVTSLGDGNFFRPTQRVLDENASGSAELAVNNDQETVETLWPHEKLCESIVKLNTGQRHIFDYIISKVMSNESPLRLFITGGAGAGKTFLLHSIEQAVSRYINLQPLHIPSSQAVVKCAITGKAAFLIRGETIHGALGIKPSNCYEHYTRLSADQLNTMQCKFRGTKVVMIDEISMVGHNFFRFINSRLKDVMHNDEPFGGLHILCFGDLFQLPPVREKWIFETNDSGLSSLELNPWIEYFELYELTEIMRQRDEKDFAELLNRMRVGKLLPNDYRELNKRVVPTNVNNDNLDCLHLFSTNDAANDYNRICFIKSNCEKDQVMCVDTIVNNVTPAEKALIAAALLKRNEFSGISRCLNLGIGLTYEITQNINVHDGLFNGTSGILRFVQYTVGFERPMALWFEFEEEPIGKIQRRIYSHYRIPEIAPSWTPVFAITREFRLKDPKATIRRKQFPIHQSSGKTIHKAQGCTVPEIAIQLSDFIFRNGFYVACSRVPKISSLHILNFAPNQILTDKKVSDEMERLRSEKFLRVQIDIFPNKEKWFCLYYCNVQSLTRHINYLRQDVICLSSNLILLNESHLISSDENDDIQIPGFNMYRFDSHVTESGRRPYNGLIVYSRPYFDVSVLRTYRCERYEYLYIEISTGWDRLYVVLVYVKPQSSRNIFMDMFHHIFTHGIFPKTTVIGDFNLDTYIHENHVFLHNLAQYYYLNINFTKSTTSRQTRIDHCLSTEPTAVSCRYVPWSYHTAFVCQF